MPSRPTPRLAALPAHDLPQPTLRPRAPTSAPAGDRARRGELAPGFPGPPGFRGQRGPREPGELRPRCLRPIGGPRRPAPRPQRNSGGSEPMRISKGDFSSDKGKSPEFLHPGFLVAWILTTRIGPTLYIQLASQDFGPACLSP